MQNDKAVQLHVDALYELIGYVIERCPKACDQEMEDRFQGIIRSFQNYAHGRSQDPPEAWEAINNDSLGRNYTIANTVVLQKFVNKVRQLASVSDTALLREALVNLDTDVDRNFVNFFAEPFEDSR